MATRLAWKLRAVRKHRRGASRWCDCSEVHLAYVALKLGGAVDADRPLLVGLTTPAFLAVTALADATFFGSEIAHDLVTFKSHFDLVVANRRGDEPADVADKVRARDPFRQDWAALPSFAA